MLALLLASALAAGPAASPADDAPVLTVGPVALTASAVTARVREGVERGGRLTAEEFVEAVIDEAVLAADARRSGLLQRSRLAAAAAAAERAKALAEAFVEREILPSVKPEEAYLRTLFHSTGDTLRLDLIVLASQADAAAVRARLDHGGEFGLEVARSLDPYSSRRKGDTGNMLRGQLPAPLADAAMAAPLGALVGPVEYSPGWAIARVTERHVGTEAEYAARRPAVLARANREAAAAGRRHVIDRLRTSMKVTVDDALLEKMLARTDPTPAEADRVIARIGSEEVRFADLLPSIKSIQIGSHGIGPAARRQIAQLQIDDRVLAQTAVSKGLDRLPPVAAAVRLAEDQALARSLADEIGARLPPSATPGDRLAAVMKRIGVLRKELPITVDRARSVAAAKAALVP